MSRRMPFEEIERLFERMGAQFEDASQQLEGLSPEAMTESTVAVDVVDRGDEFAITAELPGFEPDDVDLHIVDQTLSLEADRSEEMAVEETEFVHHERSRQSVSRRLRLPEPVDPDDVTATMEQGLLTVTIPKAIPESGGHDIDIE